MLTAGLISAVIGEQLPGHGAIYMSQSLKFLAPVRPGDLVYAEVKVTDIQIDKRRVKLDCKCEVDGKTFLSVRPWYWHLAVSLINQLYSK